MNAPSRPPTIYELLNDPEVIRTMEAAWIDSSPNDASLRHEEGGWIYLDTATGTISTRRSSAGGRSSLNLGNPPYVPGAILVGTFHTHPHPASAGWRTGPSGSDQANANLTGVPWLIRAEDGYHSTGPDSRRGGLSGSPGFPF